MTTSVITAVTEVFTAIADWLVDAFAGIMPMFYSSETGLTFLGVLASAALGFSICMMLIQWVNSFLHFRS